jgi:hypothetical protein
MPTCPAQISAEFLTTVLRADHALGAGRVLAFDLSSVGDSGQTGEVVRVLPRYDAHGETPPASLVAKFPASFPEARAQMHALGLYEREVRFYQDFGSDPGIAIPHCYHAEIDGKTGDFVLLLEDLSAGRNGDFWQGDVADAETAIRHLAAFHAKWWEHPKLQSTAWLRQPDDMGYYRDALTPLVSGCLPVVQQKYPQHCDGYLMRTAQRLVERWPHFVGGQSRERCTLAHSDYHPKQMFYPRNGRGRFAVFDWQSVCPMLGAVDLQRVLLMHLLPDQLRVHGDRLIALYHDVLGQHGVHEPLERLVTDTKRASLWSLSVIIFALATTDVEILNRDALAHGTSLEQRLFVELGDALEQLDALSHIP